MTNDNDKEHTALDEANDLELIIAALSSAEQDKNKKFRGHCNPWNPLYRHQDGHSREQIRNQILPNTSMVPAMRSTQGPGRRCPILHVTWHDADHQQNNASKNERADST